MKRSAGLSRQAALVAGLSFSGCAAAGTIYGTILENGAPVVNAQLTLSCPAANASTATDRMGSYRFTISGEGTCQLQYQNGGQRTSAQVIVYSDPARYDFRVDGGSRLLRQ
jgi:hypothetical protein